PRNATFGSGPKPGCLSLNRVSQHGTDVRSGAGYAPRNDVTAEDFMAAETDKADGSAPARPAAGPASALARVENWHHDVVELVDGWGWIRTLNDQLTAILGP